MGMGYFSRKSGTDAPLPTPDSHGKGSPHAKDFACELPPCSRSLRAPLRRCSARPAAKCAVEIRWFRVSNQIRDLRNGQMAFAQKHLGAFAEQIVAHPME